MTGFPLLTEADAWIENGRLQGLGCELLVSLPPSLANSRLAKGFWLEFSEPGGTRLGWFRFGHLLNIKNRGVFAAVEWRPADGPTPPRQDALLPFSMLPRGGGEDGQ